MKRFRIARRVFTYTALIAFALVVVRTARSSDKPTSLADARSAIEKNLQTPEGKAFDDRMGKEFVDKHMVPLRQCKAAGNELSDFWMLVKLDKDGAVEEALLYPSTKLGECARESYKKDKFLSPPHADYWVGIYLKLAH